jgi:SAM-dependent methyltransferase
LLGIPGTVVEGDLFSDAAVPQRFDVVYSLGLIEHVADVESLPDVVGAHLRFLKPGGTLALGCPSFLGVNHALAARLTPERLRTHNLDVMDARAWSTFERRFGLDVVFRGYVGGFEASICAKGSSTLAASARLVARILNRRSLRLLRRFNARAWSGYVLGIYRFHG